MKGGPGTERNDEQTNYFLKDYIIYCKSQIKGMELQCIVNHY